MPRPIFKDEIWGAHNGSLDPQYELVDDRLNFLNPIDQPGTEINASNLNNLFYFYNFMGVGNTKYKVVGLSTNKITETISDLSSGNLVASCVSEKLSDTQWRIIEKLYDGEDLVQERRTEYTKVSDGWEAIIA